MSLILAWMGRDRALIGVDTEAFTLDGQVGHTSKLVPIAHLSAVAAFQGSSIVTSAVTGECLSRAWVLEALFESMSKNLPALLDGIERTVGSMGAEALTATRQVLERQNVVIIGWSHRAKRFIGREWFQKSRAQGFVECDLAEYSDFYASPWDASLPANPNLSNRVAMAEYAKAQARLVHEREPDVPAGGKFICAELTPGRIQVDLVCELPVRQGK